MKKNIYIVMTVLGFLFAAADGGNLLQFITLKMVAIAFLVIGGNGLEDYI